MMTRTCAALLLAGMVVACRPSDVLSVPAPTGVLPTGSVASRSGAEGLEANGVAYLAQGFSQDANGILEWSGLLSDEFYWAELSFAGTDAGADARITEAVRGFAEPQDQSIQALMLARLTLLTALPLLQQYEPASGRAKIGLAFALTGYTELLVAEDFCAGMTLASPSASGVTYGAPLTTDALLAVAEAHFDSAIAAAGTDAVVAPLASVGLGRTRLDRANFAGAAAAVATVPTGFVYNAYLEPGGYNQQGLTESNVYEVAVDGNGCAEAATADRKGQNGLNYVSANDPRLVFTTTLAETCDGSYVGAPDSVWYYPLKFGSPSNSVPLSTGVEARLIEAEAALHAGQVATWSNDLNALRADAPSTYLALASGVTPLTADSTTTAAPALQVDVMFRERAFWLYGMGSRLGDLRRLVRQYSRDQSTVYSVGPYPAPVAGLPSSVPSYGTDVNLTLPTAAGGVTNVNPGYKGCIAKGA